MTHTHMMLKKSEGRIPMFFVSLCVVILVIHLCSLERTHCCFLAVACRYVSTLISRPQAGQFRGTRVFIWVPDRHLVVCAKNGTTCFVVPFFAHTKRRRSGNHEYQLQSKEYGCKKESTYISTLSVQSGLRPQD